MTTPATILACDPKNYLLQNTLAKNILFQNKYDNATDHDDEKYRVQK